jgi:RND superfamily putative drug exporter
MRRNFAADAGRWSARHRRKAILGWFALVLIATFAGRAMPETILPPEEQYDGESRIAELAIADAGFPEQADELVLIQGRGGVGVSDPAFAAAVEDVTVRLAAIPHVSQIESPLALDNRGQLSADGRSGLVTYKVAGDEMEARGNVEPALAAVAAAQAANPGVRVEAFGHASAGKALMDAIGGDFEQAGMLSVPLTLLILVVAFGSLVAAGLPLVLGVTAVITALGLLGPLSQVLPVVETIKHVMLLIGLAVGVDYSMFYVRRFMEERDAGKGPQAALIAAAATSGRSVLISGITVMIAMAGMYISGNAVFASFATGTILVVAVAVAGSLTFLPGMLSWLGERDWLEKGRVPYVGRLRHRTGDRSRVWGFILDRVLRRPLLFAVLAVALLLTLAVPALQLRTIETGFQGMPHDLPVMQTYARIQSAFPGGPQPASVVVQAPDVRSPAVQDGIAALRREAVASGQMAEPITVTANPRGDLAIVAVPLAGTGSDEVSTAALETLREAVIPATIGAVEGARVHVGGDTAGSVDFNARMAERLPFVFAFVLGLAFVLLLRTFRSVVIPITCIVLNLLSVGAAYGIIKLVFQDGRGEELLDYTSLGGITSWLPLFLFVILFGLSMDYHVFILSRIREAADRGLETGEAVASGIKATAGVVTSAAVVMIGVFSIFATLSWVDAKMMGVGLAAAVLIDATVVRAVLLPATMKLLGDWNWYLPRWLGGRGRAPAVAPVVTGPPAAPVAPVAAAALTEAVPAPLEEEDVAPAEPALTGGRSG